MKDGGEGSDGRPFYMRYETSPFVPVMMSIASFPAPTIFGRVFLMGRDAFFVVGHGSFYRSRCASLDPTRPLTVTASESYGADDSTLP